MFQDLHVASSVGALMLLLGFLVHLAVFMHSLVLGARAPQNPWGGLTMEWEASTPPSEHNFEHEPLCKHGPYDYDTTVPPGWSPSDYPIPAENLRSASTH
jgi:cytochrome c oxidase subunit 1